MSPETLVSISRSGKMLGQFPLEAVRSGMDSGRFTRKDYYWTKGMSGWKSLDELPEPEPVVQEIVIEEPAPTEPLPEPPTSSVQPTAPAPATVSPTVTAPPPPMPTPTGQSHAGGAPPLHPGPSKPSDLRTTARTVLLTIGGLVFCYGLFGDPTGSALRQQILVQHMTNGLLFIILALMVKKWD